MSIVRKDFPFFNKDNNIVFFDSAASTQKPQKVINKLSDIYSYSYANIHRGLYDLSANLTADFEKVRGKVAIFINANSAKEVVFTKNATEAINLVAFSYGKLFIHEYDEILISTMEHHSNIVPWQQLCKEKNAKLRIVPITKDGDIKFDELDKMVSNKTKIIAITQMSNVFGSVVDIKKVVNIAKKVEAKVLVDACQSIAHMKIDVQDLGCDFLAFSSHKMYGPIGVGILYGKIELLDVMKPYQTGGAMVKDVAFNHTTFLNPPHKFEAGTPTIVEVIAFGAALDYLSLINLPYIWQEERKLTKYIEGEIRMLGNYKILGSCDTSIISILHSHAHHSDIGELLNQHGIAIRTGHHCTQPLIHYLGITGTARISLGIYNNFEDANRLLEALKKINKTFTT